MTAELESRLRRVEDRQELAELVLLYFHVMDERDLDLLPKIFTQDAHLGSGDGVFDATGLDTIAETYQGRFDALGATFHYSHGLIVAFDDADPDVASGTLTGHAEVVRNGTPMIVGLRYADTYRRTSDGWRIANRVMSYFYYTPADRYVETMRTGDRNLAYGDPRPADWPSVLTGGDLSWLRSLANR
ncbi:nuclear transport factor 2 family protein [Gordonia sp. (in: high G+C Gram-positive bacteria)]|uniref:nuclear transport factor 2 family protein n=1 Tax=Gordonia sp. (in: high G+C Gram-positive bacteria) TaxID=84139 RepID=UPI003F9931C3